MTAGAMPIAWAGGGAMAIACWSPVFWGAPMGSVPSIDDRRSVVAILFIATAGAFLTALLAFSGAPFAFKSSDTSSECRPKSKPCAAFFLAVEDTEGGATGPPKASGATAFWIWWVFGTDWGDASVKTDAPANALLAFGCSLPQPPW